MKRQDGQNDLGQADVHVDGPMKFRKRTMDRSRRRNGTRYQATSSRFRRSVPTRSDAAHASQRDGAAFEQNKGSCQKSNTMAKRNILKAYKRFRDQQDEDADETLQRV